MTEISKQLTKKQASKRFVDNINIVVPLGNALVLSLGLLTSFHPWTLPLVLVTCLVQCALLSITRLQNERNGDYGP